MGEENGNEFLAKFGLGPAYKPKPRRMYDCPRCEGHRAYMKTIHEDTSMEEVVLYCPDCSYRSDG